MYRKISPRPFPVANFCACRKPCKLTRGKRWRSIMPSFLVEFMAKLSAELQGGRWRWMKRFCAALHRRRQPTGDLWYSLPKSSALVEDMPQKLSKEHRSLSLAEQAGEHAEAAASADDDLRCKTLVAELRASANSTGARRSSSAWRAGRAAERLRPQDKFIWRRSCLAAGPSSAPWVPFYRSVCRYWRIRAFWPSADSAFSPASGTIKHAVRTYKVPTGTVIRSKHRFNEDIRDIHPQPTF